MISQQHRDLLKRHLEAENAHKLDETLATLSEDCIFEDKALGKIFHGHLGAAEYYQAWWNAFEMTVHTEYRYYPEPELVIVETHFKGKHISDFFGLKATNREIDIPIAVFISLKNGLMTGERFYWDRSTLFSQLDLAANTKLNI